MSYIKQNFASGQILKADQLNHIEEGIENIENKMPPENPGAYQQLVTDADGNIAWEDKLAYTTKEEQEFIPEVTIEKGWTGILTASVMGSTGDRVIVTYNDVVYQGTLNTDNSTIWRVIFDEGVNFPESDLLVCAPGMNANGFSWQVGGTIKATILADKYHTLPNEYLGIAVKPGDDDTSVKIAPDSTGDGEASYYSVSMQSGHATGAYSVALGDGNSEGALSFTQGSGTAKGQYSAAFGKSTYASSTAQIATGQYNIEDAENKYAHIVGNGERVYDPERYKWNILPSNAHTLDWDGNAWFAGNIKVGGTGQDDETAVEVATKSDIELLSEKTPPSVAEPYQQLVTDADGNKKWEDRLAYTNIVDEVIVEEFTASANSVQVVLINPLTIGESYTIKIGEEIFQAVAKETGNQGIDPYLGNLSLIGQGENTGESFLFMMATPEQYSLGIGQLTNKTISISGPVEKTTIISEKYLPGLLREGEGKYSLIANHLNSTASGDFSFSTGFYNNATGNYSHSEGFMSASNGEASHAEGQGSIASSSFQHAQGKYNIEDSEDKYAHIVGNGESSSQRSNAHTLDWNGVGWFAGGLKIGGTNQDDAAAEEVATKSDIPTNVSQLENDKQYITIDDVPVEVPDVATAHQYLTTNSEGEKVWEDKLAYTVTTEQEIIPLQTATGNTAWYLNDSMTVNPTAGDVYIVEINGEKYESVIKAETALGGFYLGNAHLYKDSYEDTGESFLFMGLRVNISKTAYFNDDGTHTFRVYGLIEESTHIPAKYLPGGIKPGVGTNSLAVNGVLSEDVTAPNSFAANSAKAKQTDAFGANFGEALGAYSFASGRQTVAKGTGSFVQGFSTVAAGNYQHVSGKSNIEDTEGIYAHIVGNGSDALTPSNAHTLDWDGNAWFQGTIKLGGSGQDDETAVEVATKSDVAALQSSIDTLNGTDEGSVKHTVAESVATIVANAPEDFDTLKEIADWIANDTLGTADLLQRVSTAENNITTHINNKENPHNVTLEQIGLTALTNAEIDAICGVEIYNVSEVSY